MTNPSNQPRNAESWAKPVDRMDVGSLPNDAINLNVQGRRPTSPLQGFGQMWQKTYRIELDGPALPPAEIIKVWKARFPEFWPKGNRFYGPMTGTERVFGAVAAAESIKALFGYTASGEITASPEHPVRALFSKFIEEIES